MAECIELRVGEEAGMSDGAAMTGHLDQSFIFVCLRGIIDIDEAIGAAREKRLRCVGVELYPMEVNILLLEVGRLSIPR